MCASLPQSEFSGFSRITDPCHASTKAYHPIVALDDAAKMQLYLSQAQPMLTLIIMELPGITCRKSPSCCEPLMSMPSSEPPEASHAGPSEEALVLLQAVSESSAALCTNLSHPAKPMRRATLQLLAQLPEQVLAGLSTGIQQPHSAALRAQGVAHLLLFAVILSGSA